ncbi:hypothetical protein B0T10DRAFT_467434 [Thelonectria olida]|uniref:Uncharacterized protein n=1 Tax=Thelonectria olida TaxID=1576542 RepID=A0A9P8VPZ6_9HYPO|nr:hypothetical protein B0T10DRAFT_467434 [Thelonectria olida]
MNSNIPVAYDLASIPPCSRWRLVCVQGRLPFVPQVLTAQSESLNELNVIVKLSCSPHIGNLYSLGLTFMIARRLADIGLEVSVTCDLWDRAKGEQHDINPATYQRSLRDKGKF